ncbi:MAG: alpha/beta hydrolase [Thermoleophilaceae bacterium]|nr:alpha/beta hydrolase [Thermoleophilaceae bacterium]
MPNTGRRTRRPILLLLALLAIAATAGCTLPRPASESPLRYLDPVFPNLTVTRDITYGNAPGINGTPEDLKLDLYQPTGDTVTKRPALLWIHGGGFTQGDKSGVAGNAAFFARLGYVVAAINYRLLSPVGCGGNPDPTPTCRDAALGAQHDAQAAVRWLRKNASTHRIDTDRIASGGGSAGAVTSLLVDWRPEDPGTSGNPGFPSSIRAAVSVSGGTPTNEWIDSGDGPAIFFHGTADRTVPYTWAVQNAGAMFNLGILTVLEPFEGAGHGIGQPAVIHEQASYFLWRALDLSTAAK